MNSFLNKLERKYGRYAINNLSLYLIIGYGIGYILTMTGSMEFISLNPYKIIHGQIFRIVTWILNPPSSFSIFTIIMLFFYYSIGTSLERTWGAFRYNLYIFSGFLFTIIGAFILYVIYAVIGNVPGELAGALISRSISTYYVNMSIFLAFAASYPDMQVLLYFIIPLKIKWLAYIDALLLLIDFISNGMGVKIAILASLLNFILFFLGMRNVRRFSPKEIHRRQSFKRAVNQSSGVHNGGFSGAGVTKHKCAICGRTENDGDHLEFRFCSKCNGNYEYCQDHLFTHKHVQ